MAAEPIHTPFMSPTPPLPKAGKSANQKAAQRASKYRRLEAALRDNLKKRKRQARARAAAAPPEDESNLRPRPYQGRALPLSYGGTGRARTMP